jgi:hypothetical protein
MLLISCLLAHAQFPLNDNPGDTLGIWNITTFDEPAEFITIGLSESNIWQIGHPQKVYFNSAYEGNKAIVTDTLNPYPLSNYSYFDLVIGNFNYNAYWFPYSALIDFRHKFDSDTLRDGGYITVSWDKGQTWENVIYNTIPMQNGIITINQNLYTEQDTLFNGEKGFSGRSNGWVHSSFGWEGILVKKKMEFPPDTAIVRFNFISDNNHNPREGWMIDQIRLFSVELNGGLSNDETGGPTITVLGNPIRESLVISLDKPYASVFCEICAVDGRKVKTINFSNKREYRLNREGIANGIYLLKITIDKNYIETKKLLLVD